VVFYNCINQGKDDSVVDVAGTSSVVAHYFGLHYKKKDRFV